MPSFFFSLFIFNLLSSGYDFFQLDKISYHKKLFMSTPFLKTFHLALTGLKTNKTRTTLSMLGVVIGVAAVIVIVSVGEGLKSLIVGQIDAFGPNLMSVEVKVPGSDYENNMRSVAQGVIITTLKAEDAEAIRDKKTFPYVKAASGYSAAQELASYQEKEKRILIIAADSFYQYIDGQLKVGEGRFFTEEENRGVARVVVIGSDVAKKFFTGADPVGKRIKIKQTNFEVIGVLKSRGAIMGFNMDEVVMIPIKTVQKLISGVDYILEIGIQLEDQKYFPQATAEVTQLMRKRHNIDDPKNDDFQIVTMAQALDIINTVTGAISFFLGILAAISLLVGGVGIMNIMYVIVTERTKEIGLRKALGAKKKDILSQFIAEAVLICLFGGVIGIVFGILVSFAATYAIKSYGFDWPFTVSFLAVVVSFSVAAFFGIVFGWYPAQKAAKMNPIEALRYE